MPNSTLSCLNIPLPDPHKGKIVILGFGDPITLYPSEYERVMFKEDVPSSSFGFEGSLINTRDTDLFGENTQKAIAKPRTVVEPYKYGINFEVANKDYLRYIKLVELARQSQDHVVEVTLQDYTQPLYEDLEQFVDDEELWKANWQNVFTEYKGVFVNAEISGTTVYERKPRNTLKLEFVESQWRGAPVNPGFLNLQFGTDSVKVYPSNIEVSLISRELANGADGIVDLSEFQSITAFTAYKYRFDVTITTDLLGLQTNYLDQFDLYDLYKSLVNLKTKEISARLNDPQSIVLDALFDPSELGVITDSYDGIITDINITLPEKDKKNSSTITFSFVEKDWRGGQVSDPGFVTLNDIRLYPSNINLNVIYQDINGSSGGFIDIAEGIALPTFRAYKFRLDIEVDFNFFDFIPEYTEQYDTYKLFKQISDLAVTNLNQALSNSTPSTLSLDWSDDTFSGYVLDVTSVLPKEGKKFGTVITFSFVERDWRGTPPNPGTVSIGGVNLYPSNISVTTLKDSVGGSTDNFIKLREALYIPVVEPYKYRVEITTDFNFFDYSPAYLSQGEMYQLFEDVKDLKDLSTEQLKTGLPTIPLTFSLGGETLIGFVSDVSFTSEKFNPKFNSSVTITFIESDWRGLEDFEDICFDIGGVMFCPSNVEVTTLLQDVVANNNGFRDIWEGKDIPVFQAYKYQLNLVGKYGPTVAQTKFLSKTETYQLYEDLKAVRNTDLNNRATGNGANISLSANQLNLSLIGAITELSATIPQEATAYNSEISLTFLEKEWRGGDYQPKTVSIAGLEFIAENISVELLYDDAISGGNSGVFNVTDGSSALINLPYKYSVTIELSSTYESYRPGETASAVNIYKNLQSSVNSPVNCQIFDGDIDLNIGVISQLSLSNPKNDAEFGSRVSINFVESSWREGFTPYTARLGSVEFVPENVSVALEFDTSRGDFFIKKEGVWESNKLPYKYAATITYSSKFQLDSLSGTPSAYEIYSLLQAEVDKNITCSIPEIPINKGILTSLNISSPRENAEFGSTVTATITEIAWRGDATDFFADFVVTINGFPIYPASLSLNKEFDSSNNGRVTDETPFKYSLSTQTLSDLNEFRPPGLPSNLEIFKGLKASETTELDCVIPGVAIQPGYITSLALDSPINNSQYDYGFNISFTENEFRNATDFELGLKVVVDGLDVFISSLGVSKEFDTSNGDSITEATPFRYSLSIQGVSDNDIYRPESAPSAIEVFNQLSLIEDVELSFVTPDGSSLKPGYITNISLNTPVSDNSYDASVSFSFIEKDFNGDSELEIGSYVTVGPVQFFAASISASIEYDTGNGSRIKPDTPFRYNVSFNSVNDRYEFGGTRVRKSAKEMFTELKNLQNSFISYSIPDVNTLGVEAYITSLNLNNSVSNGEDDSSLSISINENGFRNSENSQITLKVLLGSLVIYPSSFSLTKEFENSDNITDETRFKYSASISSVSDNDEIVPDDASLAKDVYDFLISEAGQSTSLVLDVAGKTLTGYVTNVSINAAVSDGQDSNSVSFNFVETDFSDEEVDIGTQITIGGETFFVTSLSVNVEYDSDGDDIINDQTPYKYSFSANSVSDQYEFSTLEDKSNEQIFQALSTQRTVGYSALGISNSSAFITGISLNKSVTGNLPDDSFSISWTDSRFTNANGSDGQLILMAGVGNASIYISSISVNKEYDTESGGDVDENTPFKYSVSISSVSDNDDRLPKDQDGKVIQDSSDSQGIYEAIQGSTGVDGSLFLSGLSGFFPGYFTNVSLNVGVTSSGESDSSVSFSFTETDFRKVEDPLLETLGKQITLGGETFFVTSLSVNVEYDTSTNDIINDQTPYKYSYSANSVSDQYEYGIVGNNRTKLEQFEGLSSSRIVQYENSDCFITSVSLNSSVTDNEVDNSFSVSWTESQFTNADGTNGSLIITASAAGGGAFYVSSVSVSKEYDLSGDDIVTDQTPFKYSVSISSVSDRDDRLPKDANGEITFDQDTEAVYTAIVAAGTRSTISVVGGNFAPGFFSNVSLNVNVDAAGIADNSISFTFTEAEFRLPGQNTPVTLGTQITLGGQTFFVTSLSVSVEYDFVEGMDYTPMNPAPYKYSYSANSVSDQYEYATIGSPPITKKDQFQALAATRSTTYTPPAAPGGGSGGGAPPEVYITSIALNSNVTNNAVDDSFSVSWTESRFTGFNKIGPLIVMASVGQGNGFYVASLSVSKEYDTSQSDIITDTTPFKYSVSISSVSDRDDRLPKDQNGMPTQPIPDATAVYGAIVGGGNLQTIGLTGVTGGFNTGYFTNVSLNPDVLPTGEKDCSLSFTFIEKDFRTQPLPMPPPMRTVTIGGTRILVSSANLSIQYISDEGELIDDSTPFKYALSASSVPDQFEYTLMGVVNDAGATYEALAGKRAITFACDGVTSNEAHITSISLNQAFRNNKTNNSLSISVSESKYTVPAGSIDDTQVTIGDGGSFFYPSSVSISKQYQSISGLENGGYLSIANNTTLRLTHPYKYSISVSSVRDKDPQNFPATSPAPSTGTGNLSPPQRLTLTALEIYSQLKDIQEDETIKITVEGKEYTVLITSASLNRSSKNGDADNSASFSALEAEWTIPART